jgi:hypothetical protein
MSLEKAQRNLVRYANSIAQEKGAKVAQQAAQIANDESEVGQDIGALEIPPAIAAQKQAEGIENVKFDKIVEYGDGFPAKEQYNITTPSGEETTMTMPLGSTKEEIEARRDEMLKPYLEAEANKQKVAEGGTQTEATQPQAVEAVATEDVSQIEQENATETSQSNVVPLQEESKAEKDNSGGELPGEPILTANETKEESKPLVTDSKVEEVLPTKADELKAKEEIVRGE